MFMTDEADGYKVDLFDTFLADVNNSDAVQVLDAVKSEDISVMLSLKNLPSQMNLLEQTMPEDSSLNKKSF